MRCKTEQRKGSRSAKSSGIVASRWAVTVVYDPENGSAGVRRKPGEINDHRPGAIWDTEFGLSPSQMKGAFGNEGALPRWRRFAQPSKEEDNRSNSLLPSRAQTRAA